FHNFDVEKVAAMTEEDVDRLMKFGGIVKNRRKIQSAISNARLFIEIQKEFGSFFNYLRSFFHSDFPVVNHPATMADIPVTSPESDAIAKDMKRRGFKFFGSIICYAHLQATGFVDDHLIDCHCKSGH
ncbi:DNA-3-methyladenine glycosylase I, partial [Bacteroides acidifaciens]